MICLHFFEQIQNSFLSIKLSMKQNPYIIYMWLNKSEDFKPIIIENTDRARKKKDNNCAFLIFLQSSSIEPKTMVFVSYVHHLSKVL